MGGDFAQIVIVLGNRNMIVSTKKRKKEKKRIRKPHNLFLSSKRFNNKAPSL